jgi:hypothetical protein
MSTDINKIAQDGFSLAKGDKKLKSLAMVSLKIALQAYFSTFKAMMRSVKLFEASQGPTDQAEIDSGHNSDYCQNCAEAIVHFQHFAELVCKDFLRAEHDLLAIDATQKPVILHKLLKKETVTEAEYERINTVEFGEALTRLCALIKEGRIGVGKLEFISDAKNFLETLNTLRNREWHRGAFILRYPALDHLVGEHILPFVSKVIALPEYADLTYYWTYQKLACGIDPIGEIISACHGGKFDLKKVALLKELGRAAYENPLFTGPFAEQFNKDYHRRAKHLAESEVEHGGGADLKICPVCGIKSLVVYDDTYYEDEDHESGTFNRGWRFTWQVQCMCCTFEITDHLENPSKYGLAMEDFWQAEKI